MSSSIAICAVAKYVRSVTLRQASDEDARAELEALAEPWTGLRIRLVSSCEEYDSSRHFDVLLADADGTYTVSFAPADGLPWPLRGVHRWSEGDLVRVNGTTLRIQQAVACLDFVWERDDLLDHLVNVCLVEEELAAREPFPVSDTDLQVRLDEFRRARGLFTAADTYEWLAQHGISHRQLEQRLADALRVELLAEQVVGNAVPDYAKANKSELGTFPVMLASARSHEDLQELKRRTADPAGGSRGPRLRTATGARYGVTGSTHLTPHRRSRSLHPVTSRSARSARCSLTMMPTPLHARSARLSRPNRARS